MTNYHSHLSNGDIRNIRLKVTRYIPRECGQGISALALGNSLLLTELLLIWQQSEIIMLAFSTEAAQPDIQPLLIRADVQLLH